MNLKTNNAAKPRKHTVPLMPTGATKPSDSTEATIEEPILVRETTDTAKATNTGLVLVIGVHEMTKAHDDEPNSHPCFQLELCTAQIETPPH